MLIPFTSLFMSGCNSSNTMSVNNIQNLTPFGVCYTKVTPSQVMNYKLVIVEPDFYSKSEVDALKATGVKIIAYTTLGEVDPNRWYFPILEEHGFLGQNTNWNSHFLNLSDERTRHLIVDRVLPEIMMKGFDGIFMDTIDAVAPYTDRSNLIPYMSEIIHDIRSKYPKKIIIQNAGLFLLDKTSDVIDAILIEDIASGYDFEKNDYFIKNKNAFEERAQLVRNTTKDFNIPIFIVDFAEFETSIKEIKSRLDELNYPYFISNIQLSQLPENPDNVTNKIRGK